MKGTEKQIAWAEDIKAAIIEGIDFTLAALEQERNNPKYAHLVDSRIDQIRNQRAALISCDTAYDIIDCFSGVSNCRTPLDKASAFASACRVIAGNNPTQRKLLGQ